METINLKEFYAEPQEVYYNNLNQMQLHEMATYLMDRLRKHLYHKQMLCEAGKINTLECLEVDSDILLVQCLYFNVFDRMMNPIEDPEIHSRAKEMLMLLVQL